MDRFYHQAAPFKNPKMGSDALGIDYARWWFEKSIDDYLGSSSYSLGITISQGDLEWLTRRALAITDTVLFTHAGQGEYKFAQQSIKPVFLGGGESGSPPQMSQRYEELGIILPSITELGEWLRGCEPIARKGLVSYLPVLAKLGTDGALDWQRPPKLLDLLVDGRDVDYDTERETAAESVQKVCSLEIPLLHSGTLKQFSDLVAREAQVYEPFRDLMRSTVLKLGAKGAAELSSSDKIDFELAMSKGMRDVVAETRDRSRLKGVEKGIYATGSLGALATLYAVPLAQLPSFVAAAIGTMSTGGIIVQGLRVSRDLEKNKRDLQKSGWYFLWRLERLSDIDRPRRSLARRPI
ncbi:hypothetical protein [Streptomyces mirabilis]